MATPSESLYSVFLADLSESERERVQHLAEQFGIDPTDAVWALMIVLGRYSDIYAGIPKKIEITVQGLLEKIREAAGDGEAIRAGIEKSVREAVVEIVAEQAQHMTALYQDVPARIDETVRGILGSVERAAKSEALAARNRMHRSLGRMLLNVLMRPEGRKELLKGFAAVLAVAALIFGCVIGVSYWAGFDHGRVRGFQAGAEGRVVNSWALSSEGMGAYELWKSGELGHLLGCDRPGWKMEGGVCVPWPSGSTVYGWKLR